jgi:hypothetical protein
MPEERGVPARGREISHADLLIRCRERSKNFFVYRLN